MDLNHPEFLAQSIQMAIERFKKALKPYKLASKTPQEKEHFYRTGFGGQMNQAIEKYLNHLCGALYVIQIDGQDTITVTEIDQSDNGAMLKSLSVQIEGLYAQFVAKHETDSRLVIENFSYDATIKLTGMVLQRLKSLVEKSIALASSAGQVPESLIIEKMLQRFEAPVLDDLPEKIDEFKTSLNVHLEAMNQVRNGLTSLVKRLKASTEEAEVLASPAEKESDFQELKRQLDSLYAKNEPIIKKLDTSTTDLSSEALYNVCELWLQQRPKTP